MGHSQVYMKPQGGIVWEVILDVWYRLVAPNQMFAILEAACPSFQSRCIRQISMLVL